MIRLVLLFLLTSVAQAADSIPVATVAIKNSPISFFAEGLVEAVKQSTVSAQISGRISAVHFDVGDTVKKGQIVARIDPAEVDQAFNESRAVLAQANADYENAKANYERAERLFGKHFVSQAALDKAKAEFEAAKSQVEARKAGLSIAATRQSYSSVVAPFSGVVSARHVQIGETVTPGKPLMSGFDPSKLRVVVDIPQYKLDAVKANKQAWIEFPAVNKTVQPASISIAPSANVLTHTTQIRLDLPPNMPGFYPGMFARAGFAIGRANKMVIPKASVVHRSEVVAVYVVDAAKVTLRQIRLGEEVSGDEVEVLSGLSAGEKVALDPIKAGLVLKSAR